MPVKEKTSKLSVCVDLNGTSKVIGEIEFNMTEFKYGKYNGFRYFCEEPVLKDFSLIG